ncbi:hypothetical protein AKO1_007089 [Acrasis kona]|uniref:Uncharacterized protein n=1 Tax=Acrasis kona TaxID=1008807 RepID=A0AAW2YU65_9EUKA
MISRHFIVRAARLPQIQAFSSIRLYSKDVKIGDGVMEAKDSKLDAETGATQKSKGPINKSQDKKAEQKKKIEEGKDVNNSAGA